MPSDCGRAPIARSGGSAWTCTFVDEFNGSKLDPDRWTPLTTDVNGQRTGLECLRDSPDTIAVADGRLRLTVRRAGRPFRCASPRGDFTTGYTAGMVTSALHFSQAYGLVEIRARFPRARTPGLQASLWLYPRRENYGPWPASGEIDLAEWFSNVPDLVVPTLHFTRAGRPAQVTERSCQVPDSAAFHDYQLLWTPRLITTAVDGHVCLRASPVRLSDLGPDAPFDKPFALLLAQGIGVRQNRPIPATARPATLEVDRVAVWR